MAARSLSAFPISPSNPQSIPKGARDSPVSLAWNRGPSCLASSFNGSKLSVAPPRSRRLVRRFNSAVATVLLSLPTGKPDRASTDKLPKWSARAIKSFAMAELEARKLKYPNTGTEALLMGILVEGESGEITTTHLLLGIWFEKESAGHMILSSLGFTEEKADEVAKSMDKDVILSYE
ncbi:hypothetical protein EUGRSUZ_A02874 [Eucalyptus grandis]|uniref:Uncharacterized protein n=2 Tax=Eucalyptus grandis TaxID=71139 RepID=A0ACC3M7X9_EUCGR|nr:hypothetical protein EUGRSUZ_A02874 [Eucalyptus grandis]